MTTSLRLVPLCSLLLGILCAPAIAQCTNPWSAENGPGGLNIEAHAVHRWDRDGAGPLPAVWVFGGDFGFAGPIGALRLAAFDPATQTWSAFGSGLNARPYAMAPRPHGNLVVGGEFTTAGGIPTNHIAVWNGTAWAAMAGGLDATVRALAVLPNGELVAGGQFSTPGGGATMGIARWNGTAWGPIGAGFTLGTVRALAVHPNGDLFATGSVLQLTAAGPFEWVVRWNGTTWAPVGTAAAPPPSPFSVNYDLLVRANGDLVLVGDSLAAMVGGASRMATWNGTTWSAMSSPPTTVFHVVELSNGELVASGSGGSQVYRRTGTSWSPLGNGLPVGVVRTILALPGNELLAVGSLTSGPDIRNAARWNGTTWVSVGGQWSGTNARVTARPDGTLVVALTENPISYVGLRAGGSWTLLGTGNHVLALATMPNGDVIAGGRFTFIGGVFANRIARWNGTSWSPLGSGIGTQSTDYVSALAVMPDGTLVAAGSFTVAGGASASCIARFDGTSWSPLGSGLGPVNALAVSPDGSLIAGGGFNFVSGGVTLANIGRWNGTSWQAIGPGLNQSVSDVAVRPDGSVAACGQFTLPGPFGSQVTGPAIWNGSAWNTIGTFVGSVQLLLTAADGDLVAGGTFTGNGAPMLGIARWNGTTWSGFGAGASQVADLALAPNGDIAVAGNFLQAGGIASPHVARLSTTCPASVTPVGSGCTGAGGSPVLAATTLPWLGATFRSRATGLPANALALEVLGHTPVSVPLIAILPQGIAGCTLTTSPELLNLFVPNAGAVDLALPLGSSIAFVGTNLYQQIVALSFGPSFDLVAMTSSNSLQLTKGSF